MRTAYGYEDVDLDFVQLVNRVMDTAGVASAPNSFMVNMLPFCEFTRSVWDSTLLNKPPK